MQKEAIQAIVASAKAAGLEDTLVVYDDNARLYRVKSQTSTGYFDDGNEVFYSFNINDNPIRNTMNETLYKVEACTYDHITSITVAVADSDISKVKENYDFDEEEIKRIMKTIGKPFQAVGYQYDKNNEDPIKKVPYMPNLELGVPYKPYQPPVPNNEDSNEESGS